MGKTRFLDSYQVLVKKTKDRFAGSKGLAIYELVLNSVTTRGENPLSAMTQDQCVDLVSTSQKAADEINLQISYLLSLVDICPPARTEEDFAASSASAPFACARPR